MAEQPTQWEYCFIAQTHDVMLLYNFTPVGSRVREYERGGASEYKKLIITLLAEGWEPLGNDHFKRPYHSKA